MSFLFDLEPEFLGLYELCRDQTMTSIERMYALYTATRYVIENQIPGDFAECGVWRGGSMMLIAHTLLRLGNTDRTLWLYDTFEGMTPPSAEDVQEMSGRSASEILTEHEKSADDPFWGVAPRAAVEENLRRTGYPIDRIRFIEGDVMTTIPSQAPSQIALLRLDTDWYASTRHEIQHLYPRIAENGVLIVDDYGYWRGARKATDEYLASLTARPLLHRVDYTGRMCVKR
ncbi:MAG TPA: TylF/MycF/NovP-related O-methyltransferase [Thermoanaerobaculia bacterium]|jgi:O-methyltransferase|nr:TylF/MycF/NovP-related O-methyltransferase [Thermoanaerobaculia bacterium]